MVEHIRMGYLWMVSMLMGKKQNSRRHQKRAVVVDDCPVAFLALKSPMKLFAANPTFDRAGSQLNATWSRSSS